MFAHTLTMRPPLPRFSTIRTHSSQPYPTAAVVYLRSYSPQPHPTAGDNLRIRPPLATFSQSNNCIAEQPVKCFAPPQNPNPLSESQKAAVAEILNLGMFLIIRLVFQKLVGDSSMVAFSKNHENAIRLINYLGLGWAVWKIINKIFKEKDDHLIELEKSITRLEKCLDDTEDLMELDKSLRKLRKSIRKMIDIRAGTTAAAGGGGGPPGEAAGDATDLPVQASLHL